MRRRGAPHRRKGRMHPSSGATRAPGPAHTLNALAHAAAARTSCSILQGTPMAPDMAPRGALRRRSPAGARPRQPRTPSARRSRAIKWGRAGKSAARRRAPLRGQLSGSEVNPVFFLRRLNFRALFRFPSQIISPPQYPPCNSQENGGSKPVGGADQSTDISHEHSPPRKKKCSGHLNYTLLRGARDARALPASRPHSPRRERVPRVARAARACPAGPPRPGARACCFACLPQRGTRGSGSQALGRAPRCLARRVFGLRGCSGDARGRHGTGHGHALRGGRQQRGR